MKKIPKIFLTHGHLTELISVIMHEKIKSGYDASSYSKNIG